MFLREHLLNIETNIKNIYIINKKIYEYYRL